MLRSSTATAAVKRSNSSDLARSVSRCSQTLQMQLSNCDFLFWDTGLYRQRCWGHQAMRAVVSGASCNVLLRAEKVNSWRTVLLRADQWRALPGQSNVLLRAEMFNRRCAPFWPMACVSPEQSNTCWIIVPSGPCCWAQKISSTELTSPE